MEIIKGIFSESFWYIAPLLMTLTVAIAGVINGAFKITKGMWPQIVAWVVGALLSVATWLLKLIEFGEPVWLGVVMLAIVVGLSSNGVYDIPTIKAFVDKWFNRAAEKEKELPSTAGTKKFEYLDGDDKSKFAGTVLSSAIWPFLKSDQKQTNITITRR